MGVIALPLDGENRSARLIRLGLAHVRAVHAGGRADIVRRVCDGLGDVLGIYGRRNALRRRDWDRTGSRVLHLRVVLEVSLRHAVAVGPLGRVVLDLVLGYQPLTDRSQPDGFGFLRAHEVIGQVGIHGRPDHAAHRSLALDDDLAADDRYNRYPLARPGPAVQDFDAVELVALDGFLCGGAPRSYPVLFGDLVLALDLPVLELCQSAALGEHLPEFGCSYAAGWKPVFANLIADALEIEEAGNLGIGVGLLVDLRVEVLGDHAAAHVRVIELVGRGIGINREGIGDTPQNDLLFEAVVLFPNRQHAHPAAAALHGMLIAGCPDHAGVAVVVDVSYETLQDLGGFLVGAFTHRTDSRLRGRLAGVVDHLVDGGADPIEDQTRAPPALFEHLGIPMFQSVDEFEFLPRALPKRLLPACYRGEVLVRFDEDVFVGQAVFVGLDLRFFLVRREYG